MASSSDSPFAFLNAISESKKKILKASNEEEYQPYLINKGLSMHIDTLFDAQTMNLFPHLDNKLQFDYLLNTVKARKRYAKSWPKPLKDDDIELIRDFFQVNSNEAISIKSILTKNQIAQLREQVTGLNDPYHDAGEPDRNKGIG